MNKTLLIGLALVLGVIAFFTEPDKKELNLRNTRVLGKLDPQSIHSISITAVGSEGVVLKKTGETWVVDSLKGFVADGSKISTLLQELFQLNYGVIVQKGEVNLETYGLNYAAGAGQGTAVSLSDSEGTTLTTLVLGNSRMSKGQYGFDVPSGQYFLLRGDPTVYLLKDQKTVNKNPMDWIHKLLPPTPSTKIQKISLRPGQLHALDLLRVKPDDPLVLTNLGDNEKMKDAEVKTLQESLEKFRFSSLEALDSKAVTESLTQVEEFQVTTHDGMVFSAKIGTKTDASANRFLVPKWSGINPADEAQKLIKFNNSQFEGWALGITDAQAKSFLKSRGELIESKPLGARHILISYKGASNSTSEKSKEEARELARGLIKQLSDGADFSKLAKEHSTDASNKDAGGNLGSFARGAMVKPFEEATLTLKISEISKEPVETVYGFHIIERTQ
ncbi:DUF4340 domain-containing protein [bacterium]|jgi:hypothetical protein|nr:DUF4340 domain-containing protein [bacterium]